MLSVIFTLLIVIACATGQNGLFACTNGYCVFEDRGTQPINYAFGPATYSSNPHTSKFMTCQYSRLPVGTPKGTCCDFAVGDVASRRADDPLIVWRNDYVKNGCHEVPYTI
ncbi:uncharacterized protein PGTG_04502 [Puccinia graminis f. sp. tritici CRL 75-36-700-3]|uniref:Secreted protein n=1 Tax=Puccinia graminis f. sp. tritici (strain CRL 75-36-700-3 / race SCCL) TaxID=418459 RepID=E3K2H7_PUCGT|nr:uncharacterized protein PGTG_04502 [Puccinia graminis f. sp. tritici CRL 75-36-700-3]EFP78546.1 hypothetical protein PGTG_04502 [Puccinia graminis f. sp. tritici CRL 75-36-700-3]